MIIAKNMLLSEHADVETWRHALLHRRKKVEFMVIVIHPEHLYPMEIMSSKEFLRVDADDIRYRVVGMADGYGSAVKLVQQAVEEVLKVDPQLMQLKQRLQEIYI